MLGDPSGHPQVGSGGRIWRSVALGALGARLGDPDGQGWGQALEARVGSGRRI